MTSSPRFWQKLGIGKQHRTSSSSTSNSDNISIHSSISFYHTEDGPVFDYNNEKQVKRLSTSSLKHKSSSVSLYRQPSNTMEKLPRRASSVHPLKRADLDSMLNNRTGEYHEDRYKSVTKLPTSLPTRKQSCNDVTKSPSRLKKTKSNQSLVSVSTTTSIGSGGGRSSVDGRSSKLRQPSTKSNSSATRKKIGHSSGEEDENKPSLTRSSSNGSTASALEKKSRRNTISRRKDEDMAYSLLKDELEMEKSSARALKGQKEAIAKDLDYFCAMVDELSVEKEEIKRKYEQEADQNKILRKAIHDLEIRMLDVGSNSDTAPTVENLQQQMVQDQYVYYNNLQLKNNEISKLKADLKQAQNQIQVLRKTMQQLLKNEENDSLHELLEISNNDSEDQAIIDEKGLLLKNNFFLDQQPEDGITMSPVNDDDDRLSATSRDSSHSHKSKAHSVHYDFLKTSTAVTDEDFHNHLTKRRSEDFSKSFARRRKDQLEEILGDVDSQLNKAKQKLRPVSS